MLSLKWQKKHSKALYILDPSFIVVRHSILKAPVKKLDHFTEKFFNFSWEKTMTEQTFARTKVLLQKKFLFRGILTIQRLGHYPLRK